MMSTCLVLPYGESDGPANMALDQAMLEAASAGDATYLRFYGWSEPTLSLGYFQRFAEVGADPRWARKPVVRRPSGGGAIWHHRELTYAIAIPPGSPLARPNTALYRAVHRAIADELNDHGIAALRRGDTDPSRSHSDAEKRFLCFTGNDPEDIVCGTRKLVGSSQRRRGQAVLQHGSLLLESSSIVPEHPGLAELSDAPASVRYWERRLATRIPRALDLCRQDIDRPPGIAARAGELERSVYRNPDWTMRR